MNKTSKRKTSLLSSLPALHRPMRSASSCVSSAPRDASHRHPPRLQGASVRNLALFMASEPRRHHSGAPHIDGKGRNNINYAGPRFLVVRSVLARNFQPLFWAGNGFHKGEGGTFYSEWRKRHQRRFQLSPPARCRRAAGSDRGR